MVQNQYSQATVRDLARKLWPVSSRLKEITARFESRCPKCSQMIVTGEAIMWEPNYAEHKVCPEGTKDIAQEPNTTPRPKGKGYTLFFDEPLWFVRDNTIDEAIYCAELEQAFDWIRERIELNVSSKLNISHQQIISTDEAVEREILLAEQQETAYNDTQRSKIPDGTYTIIFPEDDLPFASQDYVTIRIKTKGPESNYAGKQIASYLMGPDNGRDYVGFAFVDEEIHVWKKFRNSEAITKYVEALKVLYRGRNEQRTAGEAYAERSNNCFRCGRQLTVPTSIHRGLGPECAEKF